MGRLYSKPFPDKSGKAVNLFLTGDRGTTPVPTPQRVGQPRGITPTL